MLFSFVEPTSAGADSQGVAALSRLIGRLADAISFN
jgi:hypothetical protein